MSFLDRVALLSGVDKFIIGINVLAAILNFASGAWIWFAVSAGVAIGFFYIITNISGSTREGKAKIAARQLEALNR